MNHKHVTGHMLTHVLTFRRKTNGGRAENCYAMRNISRIVKHCSDELKTCFPIFFFLNHKRNIYTITGYSISCQSSKA
jgi:hypothetical protein